jgi:hypothetical protein
VLEEHIRVVDHLGRQHVAARVGRYHDAWHAEAELTEIVLARRIGWRAAHVRDARRAHVVEEAAPLVVVDEQRGARPQRRLDHRLDHVVHERLPRARVAARMLVGAQAGGEAGIDERDVRERARGEVGEQVLEVMRTAGVLRAPEPIAGRSTK